MNFRRKVFLWPAVFMTGVFALICLSAWIGDDAFITMRSVRNFLDGNGWRYNVSERVQTYTNPLLLICMTIAAFFTHEYYFTLLTLNLAAAAAALFIFYFKQKKNFESLFFCSVLMLLSASFKDYATSGLENSFGYLLSALFFHRFFSTKLSDRKDVFFLSLITGLMLLNRMDSVLIVLPALTYACLQKGREEIKSYFLPVLTGLSPFIIWEIFCIIYYGFPFPNTYYAKLQTGFPVTEHIIRGLYYYKYTLLFDTVTLLGIAAGLTALFYKPADFRFVATGIGISLYLLYIFYIGGDFMGGRFLALPFFVSVFNFPSKKFRPHPIPVLSGAAICCLVSAISFDVYNARSSCILFRSPKCALYYQGIENSKNFWGTYIYRSIKGDDAAALSKIHSFFEPHIQNPVSFYEAAGIAAFSKPDLHIVDIIGLTDPMISRSPAMHMKYWRTGHIPRLLPKGYRETLISGKNVIEDPELSAYYDKLKEVVSGELFSGKRFGFIFDLNRKGKKTPPFEYQSITGEPLLNDPADKIIYSRSSLVDIQEARKYLDKYDLYINLYFPVFFNIGDVIHSPFMTLSLDSFIGDYPSLKITFLNTQKKLKESVPLSFSKEMNISVPENLKKEGYDRIIIERASDIENDFAAIQLTARLFILKSINFTDAL